MYASIFRTEAVEYSPRTHKLRLHISSQY